MKKIAILSLIVILKWQMSFASHIVGADISYQCLDNNEYEFTLKAYRDCHGIDVQPTYRLDYFSMSCNIQGNIKVRLVGEGQDISPLCPAEASTCQGGSQPGIQLYVYKGTFTFPAQCTDWVISWRECNRNSSITNIEQPSNECLYIEATLNNVAAACNNSPAFNNPPVSFICMNQPNLYNPGTVEKDGDRLVFKAITPRSGRFTTVQYKPGFSASSPISSNPAFSIDPNSGDIAISPTAPQVTVTAILVEEWRDGVLIGSIMRDIQIISRNCDNDNPVLSGINNTLSDSIEVCAGDKLCFFINGSDPNPGQNLTMTWNQGIDTTRATFTVGGTSTNPRGDFCWQTNASDRGLYMFTVTATDDFCPFVGNATRSYKIRVHEPLNVTMPSSITIGCSETANITPTVTGNAPFNYQWNTGETTKTINKGSGNYTLKTSDSKGCISKSNITIYNGLNVNFSEDRSENENFIQFTDLSNSNSTIESWHWDFGDPQSDNNDNISSLQNPTYQYNTNGTYFVSLTVRDSDNCESSATKPLIINSLQRQPNINNWQIYNEENTTYSINKATSLRVDATGNLWLGTFDKGAFSLDQTTKQWNEYLRPKTEDFPGNNINNIQVLQGTNIYIATGFNGLGKYNGSSWTTLNTTNTTQLPYNKINDVDIETTGHLWIATDQGLAVDSADNDNWRIFNTNSSPSLLSNQIIRIKIDQDNSKWVATANHGLLSIDNEGSTIIEYNIFNSYLPSNTIRNLHIRNNLLYICTNSGLAVYDRYANWEVYKKENTTIQGENNRSTNENVGIANNDIRAISFDYLNRIILATAGGLAIKLTDGWYTLTSQNSNLPENDITDVAYNASTNEIWVATANSGIAKIHADEITDDLILNNHKALSNLEVKVFPNPANEIINIHFTEILTSDAEVTIMDLQERISLQGIVSTGSNSTSIDLSRLPKGLYILKLSLENNLSTHKIYIR